MKTGIAALVALLVLGTLGACDKPANSADNNPGGPKPASSALADPNSSDPTESAPSRMVEESGGLRVVSLTRHSCSAMAPAGWTMQATEQSSSADIFDAAGTVYAGYGIQAVNTSLATYAGIYDPPFNDPDLYSYDPATVASAYARIVVASLGGTTDLVATDEVAVGAGDYRLRSLVGSSHTGVVFFHATGFAGDGYTYSYALPMYFAFTRNDLWPSQGQLVAGIAASIRCVTQFQPPNDYFSVEAAAAGDANGDDPGYNPQLGTEYATDPTTGENYLVDPAQNWSETGPDGPGYYVGKGGGDYQQLEPGRSD